MRHQRVTWHHDHEDEPVVLWSEVGDDGHELRKVDEYRDGRLDRADAWTRTGTGSTLVGDQPIPPVEEIDRDPEFTAVAIAADEFEAVWRRSVAAVSAPDPPSLPATRDLFVPEAPRTVDHDGAAATRIAATSRRRCSCSTPGR